VTVPRRDREETFKTTSRDIRSIRSSRDYNFNCIINPYWYSKLSIMVRWNTTFSDTLRVRSGVRQGGVLSPHLFNVYADVFINSVVSKNNGCYLNRCCMACIMYADDLMLLSASVAGLQQLLDVCAHTAKDLCLQFNDKKSHCIVVGPKQSKPSSLSL